MNKQLTRPIYVWLKVVANTPSIAVMDDSISTDSSNIVFPPKILWPTTTAVDHDSPAYRIHWNIPLIFLGYHSDASCFAMFNISAIARYDDKAPKTFNLFDRRTINIAGHIDERCVEASIDEAEVSDLRERLEAKITKVVERLSKSLEPQAMPPLNPKIKKISDVIANLDARKVKTVSQLLDLNDTPLKIISIIYKVVFGEDFQ